MEASSKEQCQSQCKKKAKCMFWVFEKDGTQCTLKVSYIQYSSSIFKSAFGR
jgi:hypothetical protein